MKRYWLFGGENYYACGGMNDFRLMSDDLEALKDEASDLATRVVDMDWWHILDIESFHIVGRSENQAFGVEENHFVPQQ